MHNARRSWTALLLGGALLLSGACAIETGASGSGTPPPASEAEAPRGTGRDAGGGGFDEAGFREDLRTAENVVDGYWAKHWPRLFTGEYRPPRVVGLYEGGDPAGSPSCGGKPLERDNAVYCPAGDFVAWDEHLMRAGYARGDAWVYLVIAHEWGHAVQNRLRRELVSPAAELQADCLAGGALYGAAADGALRFEAGDEQEIVDSFRVIGDDVPWTRPGDHGSAAERLRNFARGGQGGVRACFG
ncbi:neutral zinc metallopeptidase [Spirillospora sp. NPDC050679]